MFPKLCTFHSFYFQNDRIIQGQTDLIIKSDWTADPLLCFAYWWEISLHRHEWQMYSTIRVSVSGNAPAKYNFDSQLLNSTVSSGKFLYSQLHVLSSMVCSLGANCRSRLVVASHGWQTEIFSHCYIHYLYILRWICLKPILCHTSVAVLIIIGWLHIHSLKCSHVNYVLLINWTLNSS